MKLAISTPDPFEILSSTKRVIENAEHVSLNQDWVKAKALEIADYLKDHADFPDHGHRLTGDRETDMQLIFFESMMGFCFWAFPGEPKWAIELADGTKEDGWYGVCASFKRAHEEGIPVTDADFLATATEDDVRNIFRTATGAEIPLLQKRVAILNENAQSLVKKFEGRVGKLIEAAEYDVVKLFELLLKHFPSYKDVTSYKGNEVVFLKIAHLLALDLEYRLTPQSKRPFLKNIDKLSVFADYKLPQLLREFEILKYDQRLANKVDLYKEIPQGSVEEVELRAGAVWGVELLRQQIPEYSSVQIGHVIWLMSQDQDLQSRIKPYHRTYTTFY